MIDKIRLINDLKVLHKEIAMVYSNIFAYKLENDSNFENQINSEYVNEGISKIEDKKKWNEKYIHRSAYTLLNKILFIRICEDKGFMVNDNKQDFSITDKSGQKLSKIGLQKWSGLIKNYSLSELVRFAFKDMNKSYSNIPLYKEDKYDWLIPTVNEINIRYYNISDYEKMPYEKFEILLEQIIETLDTSRYNFKNSSENVLGDVYEKFLDREVRKELGQFYTPNYIINFILEQTVENIDVCENPFVKILDPSCGSGHFLLMAYDLLREKFSNSLEVLRLKYETTQYTITSGKEESILTGEEYWTTEYLHYHILRNCIYGSDIDAFALQLTTINLLLKDLDNFITDELNLVECDSLYQWEEEVDWKSLSKQIEEGNSIILVNKFKDIKGDTIEEVIGWEQAERIIKICKFWDNEYDYIVGNPPYGSKITSDQKKYYMKKYEDVHMRTPDVYNYFISRASKKSKNSLSFIVPDSLLTQYEYTKCRTYLLENFNLKTVVSLGEKVFDDNSYPTVIFHIDRTNEKKATKMINVSNLDYNIKKEEALKNKNYIHLNIKQENFKKIDGNKLLFLNNDLIGLILHIKSNKKPLNDLVDYLSVGVASGNDKAFVVDDTTIQKKSLEKELLKPMIVGGNVHQYYYSYAGRYLIYINRSTEMDDKENIVKHLETYKEQLSSRREAKNNMIRWFELHWPRTKEQFERKKIVLRQTGDRLVASIDSVGIYNINSVIDIILSKSKSTEYSEELVTAILNSKLMNVYYNLIVQEDNRGFAEIKPVVVKTLPIPKVNKEKLEEIGNKVKDIQNTYERIFNLKIDLKEGEVIQKYIQYKDEKDKYEAHIEELKEQLENDIFEIYNLSSDHKKIINEFWNESFDKKEINNLSIEQFIEEHHNMNKPLKVIAQEYNLSSKELIGLRMEFQNTINQEYIFKLFDFSDLYDRINGIIKKEVYKIMMESNVYLSLQQIIDILKNYIKIYPEIMEIMKNGDLSKNYNIIIKEILNSYSDTWNASMKNRLANKSVKIFVKYENNIYGLSEWSDEIHKKYFIDSLEYYTSPSIKRHSGSVFEGATITKKKADAALTALMRLDFGDKDDYIELLTEKVNKTFN
ncbi:Eco57I restriction-modification methylase domain-containing protein [Solibacillus isronensis]|uniref:Eco57I restriction-modification methylase domain-containing protein n=1 Tax=Solibacillus isronensis TaxID=412383 RepID=UPI00399FCDF1